MIQPDNEYTKMQLKQYDESAEKWSVGDRDHVVGSFDAHNKHEDYETLFDGIKTENKIALDFGCGPGRNLVKYYDRFKIIDGADISSINLEKAKLWLDYNNKSDRPTKLYQTDGISLNNIPDNTYDLVFSTITLQHIAVHEIRFNILKDMFRVLKDSGWISIQMGYGVAKLDTVYYFSNDYSIEKTNGSRDVRVESSDQIATDLTKIGFKNFNSIITHVGPGDNHSNWIFFKGQK